MPSFGAALGFVARGFGCCFGAAAFEGADGSEEAAAAPSPDSGARAASSAPRLARPIAADTSR